MYHHLHGEMNQGVSVRSLDARALFEVSDDTIDTEIVRRFDEGRVKLIFDSGADSDDSTSAWKPITPRTGAFDLGLSALCGCTGLIVYSQNGAYGAHFFEAAAWGRGDAAFKKHVEYFLKNNVKGRGGLAEFSARLTRGNADVAAYILTPQQELPDDAEGAPGWVENELMYGDQVQRLVDLLPEIIPQLRGHIQVNHYQALDGMTNDDGEDVNPGQAILLDTTARGRILLQYDPSNNGARTTIG
ncbi:hypothetical protein Neosp_008725 [[Neocosmospora] mangrovei]